MNQIIGNERNWFGNSGHWAICYCSPVFYHMTNLDPKRRLETIGEASCSVVEDALSARFVGEDEVSDFICDLDAIIEQQQESDAANDTVV